MFTLPISLYSTNPAGNPLGAPHSVLFNDVSALTSTNGAGLAVGSGDFTIEMYVKPNGVASSSADVMLSSYTGTTGISIQLRTAGGYNGPVLGWGNTLISGVSGSGITIGVWTHYAWCRQGTSLRFFIDGTLVSTVTDSTNMVGTTHTSVGRIDSTNLLYYDGRLSGVRVSTIARYTANFTRPLIDTIQPDASTILLACTYGAVTKDNGINNLSFTTVGTPTISTDKPA